MDGISYGNQPLGRIPAFQTIADGLGQVLRQSTDPITLCHPVWQLGRGGLERQLVQVVNGLPRDRFQQVVVVRGWDARSEAMAAQLGDHVMLIKDEGPRRDQAWSRRLADVLNEHAVDVLHARGLTMLVDSLMAAELCGNAAVAFSFHGFESAAAPPGGIRRKVYREAVLRCDDRWAVSEAATRSLARDLNLPRDVIGVITNGVDTEFHAPGKDRDGTRKELGLPADRQVLLAVGNLKPIKGHQVLLEAVQSLGGESERLTTVFVGDDYLDGSLQQWTARHLSDRDVRFVGLREDVRPWYQAADIFVLPSLWEGMSNALLEAMSSGLPVIATRVGGNPDVIEDGLSGMMVEAESSAALCAAIRRLMNDTELRSDLGRAARERVRRRFSLERSIAAYAGRYRRLAERMSAETSVAEPIGAV